MKVIKLLIFLTLFCFRLPDFSYGGQLKIQEFYRDDASGVSHITHWSKDLLRLIQFKYEENSLNGPYGVPVVENIK